MSSSFSKYIRIYARDRLYKNICSSAHFAYKFLFALISSVLRRYTSHPRAKEVPNLRRTVVYPAVPSKTPKRLSGIVFLMLPQVMRRSEICAVVINSPRPSAGTSKRIGRSCSSLSWCFPRTSRAPYPRSYSKKNVAYDNKSGLFLCIYIFFRTFAANLKNIIQNETQTRYRFSCRSSW